ncbi:MAG: protein-(glutamine-N5) methyltransferase, release factor-specific [Deltaproteobacteria bacterium]|nr:protein-(glutamine-N5) methyltransferase, release factor-specific [Deltaproteobacteria bacterium]
MNTVVDILKKTEAFFRSKDIPSPRLDAELILCQHLDLDRVGLYLQFDRPLNESELAPMREMVKRRGNREPIAWILGSKGFWSLDLASHKDVLVPRPDSETLVTAALTLVPENERCFVADIGSGTGAIGLAIASERPEVRLFSTDISDAALQCTRENVHNLELSDRVAVLKGSLLEAIPADRTIDIVVSNPPYIPSGEIDGLAPEIATHEPRTALDGGDDGFDIYRALIPSAASRATTAVLVEIGDGQEDVVSAMMEEAGLHTIETHKDLTGTIRVVSGRK